MTEPGLQVNLKKRPRERVFFCAVTVFYIEFYKRFYIGFCKRLLFAEIIDYFNEFINFLEFIDFFCGGILTGFCPKILPRRFN